jgi:mitofilin
MLKSTAGKTAFKVVLGSSVLYAGGVALSLQNQAFNEIFTDNVPFAEEAVDFVDSLTNSSNRDHNIENFKKKFGELEKTLSIPKSGIFSSTIESVKEKEERLAEKIKETVKSVKPTYKLPTIGLKTKDTDLQRAIDEFNGLAEKINAGELNDSANFAAISEIFSILDANVTSLKDTATKEFQTRVEEAVSAHKNQLLGQFITEFNTKVSQIEKQHQVQLQKEIEANKAALDKYYENQAKLVGINAKEEITNLVAKTLEEERERKYAQFDQLDKSLQSLQTLVLKLDGHLDNADLKVKIQFQLNKIRAKLSGEEAQDLSQEVSQLKQIASEAKNDVIVSAIDAIDTTAIQQGLLTPAQLITRFNLLAPELRTAALLPPNAGVLGHLGAKLFSLLLISKQGNVEGKDIESIIARVQNNLIENRLDDAVEEVANLKGWSRSLADDWLVESRKRLEVEFLVNLIDLECRTLY